MSKRDCEEILGVAIRRRDLVYFLPKPARHHDVIEAMALAGVPTPIGHADDEQGFMTAWGFKDRVVSAKLSGRSGRLFSEDLW